jgi:hypothetical protein
VVSGRKVKNPAHGASSSPMATSAAALPLLRFDVNVLTSTNAL